MAYYFLPYTKVGQLYVHKYIPSAWDCLRMYVTTVPWVELPVIYSRFSYLFYTQQRIYVSPNLPTECSIFICQVGTTSVPACTGDFKSLHSQRTCWSWVLRQFSFQQSFPLCNSESETEVNMLTEQITQHAARWPESSDLPGSWQLGSSPPGQRDGRLSETCPS